MLFRSFDEAVNGVGAIVHMASPLPSMIDDPDGMLLRLADALHDLIRLKNTSSPLCTEP